MFCISVNVIRTANCRIYCRRVRDNMCTKLVAKSEDFRLYSAELGINGKNDIKMDIT
jgi:hypothetical protein